MPNKEWTPEEDDQVLEVLKNKNRGGLKALAEKLGRTHGAVRARSCKLRGGTNGSAYEGVEKDQSGGLPAMRAHWTDEERDKAIQMDKAGVSRKDIAEALGRTRNGVNMMFVRLGVW